MANVTVQVMRALVGYGNQGDIITILQTAQSDQLTAYGLLQTYAGPAVPAVVPAAVYRNVQSSAVAIPLPATAGIDQVVFLTAAPAVPTLPTAVGNPNRYTIKNVSGGSITPVTTSAQTIEGAVPAAIANNGSLNVISDGANWRSGV